MFMASPPPLPNNTPPDALRELPMFSWQPCPLHPIFSISVILVPDAAAWCIGDGEQVHGHWLNREQVPA